MPVLLKSRHGPVWTSVIYSVQMSSNLPLTSQLQGPRCEKDRTVILHVHGEVYFLNHMQDFITHAGTIKILMEKPGFSLVRRGKTKETECVGKKYWK